MGFNWFTGFDKGKLLAEQVTVDPSDFSGALSIADVDVQHALETLDQLDLSGYLKLNQISYQTISGGIPFFQGGLRLPENPKALYFGDSADPNHNSSLGIKYSNFVLGMYQDFIISNRAGVDTSWNHSSVNNPCLYIQSALSTANRYIRMYHDQTDAHIDSGYGSIKIGSDVDLGSHSIATPKITTSSTQLLLEQTGDTYGATRLYLQNRNGSNGAIFENATLDLIDFGFLPSSGAQSNIRLEHRSAYLKNAGNSLGEFQLFNYGYPAFLAIGNAIANFYVPVDLGNFNLSAGLGTFGTGLIGTSTDNIKLSDAAIVPSPSYANPGGSGDRRLSIVVTTTLAPGYIAGWVDGSYASTYYLFAIASVDSTKNLTFDFGVGVQKIITEFKYYQGGPNDASSTALWKMRGSQDATSWTDIGSTFTLGQSSTQVVSLAGNAVGYRYYQIIGVSGSFLPSNGYSYYKEIEFKIDDYSPTNVGYLQSYATNGATATDLYIQKSGGGTFIGKLNIDNNGNLSSPGSGLFMGPLSGNGLLLNTLNVDRFWINPANGRMAIGNISQWIRSLPTSYLQYDILLATSNSINIQDSDGSDSLRIDPSTGTFADSFFNSRRNYTSAFGFFTAASGAASLGFQVRGTAAGQGDKVGHWLATPDDYFDINTESTFRKTAKFVGNAVVGDWTIVGTQKMTNYASFSSGSWTAGTGWDITTATAKKNAAGTGTLVQTVAAMASAPVIGETYVLDVETSTYSAGASGAFTITFLGKTFYCYVIDGHHKFVINCTQITGDLTITPTSAHRFYIVAVGLTKITGGTNTVLGSENINSPQTTVSGSVAGAAVFSQPFQGMSFKKVMVYLSGLNGTASYTFPTAFANTPKVLVTTADLSALVTTISTTAVTITGAVSTGNIIIEGY